MFFLFSCCKYILHIPTYNYYNYYVNHRFTAEIKLIVMIINLLTKMIKTTNIEVYIFKYLRFIICKLHRIDMKICTYVLKQGRN